MACKRCVVCALLLSLLLTLAGCGSSPVSPTVQTPTEDWSPTPEPEITAAPAPVLSGVETDRKVVSLIFEGFTDSSTVEAIAEVLGSRGVTSMFFVSGITANENPEVVKSLHDRGFAIGSYGLGGGKQLEKLTAYENARRFEIAQDEIEAACGERPALIRCNGTEYTEDVLRAVSAAGLKAAVEPSAYLNHKSFRTQEDAAIYVGSLLRGSIISVMLGQELDESEYDDRGDKLDERPAIDPDPGIRWEWSTEEEKYALLPDIVAWLVDALLDSGYSFTDPVSLQSEERLLLRRQRELDDAEQRELDPERYELPLTDAPLRAGETRQAKTGDFRNAVFVGDAVMEGLGAYVDWRRTTEPNFLDNASFLTEDQLTVEKLLNGESDIGDLPARLKEMKAESVWLCLGFTNRGSFLRQAQLAKYRLLIRDIQKQNPDIRVVVMTVLPKVEGHAGVANRSRFTLNLLLCGMCREYGIGFADIASAVRDEQGQLREDYCLDLAVRGCHLNDEGCEAVLNYIMENYPL